MRAKPTGKREAELLDAEIALRDQCERVAVFRRKLPLEAVVQDYVLSAVASLEHL